mgnify:FL=1
MKTSVFLPILGSAAVLVLGACGGGSASDSETSAGDATESMPAATAESEAAQSSPDAASDGGCSMASVSGESNNAQLQALATSKYDSLTCGGATSLGDQLTAINADPTFQSEVAAAGWVVNFGEAAGGVSLSIVDTSGMTTCQIVVLDDLNSKGLTCGNV